MKITLGQPVHTTDGPFGELADIVIHPSTNTVTHLIVEPHRKHYQARLVPMSLVEVADERLNVKLDHEHLRALRCVAESDFVPVRQQIDLGDEWDVGIEHVKLPYENYGYDMAMGGVLDWEESMTIDYDRIPKGDCEIRHESDVMSSDEHHVGLVTGMTIDGDHIEGVLVQAGLPGFRHVVAVPITSVARVRNDQITLSIDRQKFRALTPIKTSVEADGSKLAALEHRAASVGKRLVGAVRSKLSRE